MVYKEISSHRRSPSYKCKQGDTAKIPPYRNAFCPHQRKTCHTANGQQASSNIATESNKMPVLAILYEAFHIATLKCL